MSDAFITSHDGRLAVAREVVELDDKVLVLSADDARRENES